MTSEQYQVSLPSACATCSYHQSEQHLCQRHAPSPGQEEFEIARWPLVRPHDRCGSGASLGDGTGPGIVRCGWCVHWLCPDGKGVEPHYKQGLEDEWWLTAGYCTRWAPAPSAEADRLTHWRVVHAQDGCGDGIEVPQ